MAYVYRHINMIEVWKDIPNYEKKYQVSNLGNVKSLNYLRSGKEKLMRTFLTGEKRKVYSGLTLYLNGKPKNAKVHQLVAMAFLGFIQNKNGMVVDHINNDSLDNRLENLQIISIRENVCKDIKNVSSIFTGVSYHKQTGKWESYISVNKKRKHLGLFETELEASNQYKKSLELINNNDLSFLDNSNKSSKYKGVSFDKHRNRWVSEIRINGNITRVGRFKTELEAYNSLELYKKENNVNI